MIPMSHEWSWFIAVINVIYYWISFLYCRQKRSFWGMWLSGFYFSFCMWWPLMDTALFGDVKVSPGFTSIEEVRFWRRVCAGIYLIMHIAAGFVGIYVFAILTAAQKRVSPIIDEINDNMFDD